MIEMDESEHLDILTDDQSTYYAIDRFFKHNRTITEKLLYPKPRAVGDTYGQETETVVAGAPGSLSDTG